MKTWMTMKKRAIHSTPSTVMNGVLLFFLAFLLLNCTQPPASETAKSGDMILSVDPQLEEIAGIQAETFSRYYPESRITLMPASSAKSLTHLLDGKAKAALISGKPEAAESALFAQRKEPIRLEPVARDAIVCIVNSANPVITLSAKELGTLFSAREVKGQIPLVARDDFRLLSVLAASTGKKSAELQPWACTSDIELIERVTADKQAVGLLFQSSLDGALDRSLKLGKKYNNIRIVPLAREGAGACLPTQQNIYEGRYPLVAAVYYVYYPGNALAAGFGSWLGSAGQKAFERSRLTPFRLVERTIILK
jgi:phosphate transport system substrate-binding protein